MNDELIDIARFASANEAAVARNALEAAGIPAFLDGDTTATWLWYIGSALGGVKLFVRSSDVDRARAILLHDDADDTSEECPEDACSPDDDLGEPGVDDDDPISSLPITRAWRAAIIGILLLPPLLNLYSMWVLLRHRLLFGGRTRPTDWRAFASFVVNMSVFTVVALFVYSVVRQPGPDVPPAMPGNPIEVEYTVTVPLIPAEPASGDYRLSHRRVKHAQSQTPPSSDKPGG